MLVEFTCPTCGKTFQAADEFSGKKVRCKSCRTILEVPGMLRVRDSESWHAEETQIGDAPPHGSFEEVRARLTDQSTAAPNTPGPAGATDVSYGIASLYLAGFSFLLFLTPALLAGLTGAIGVSVAFFVGFFVNAGCFLFSRQGYKLAEKAEELSGGQGYAAAGKIVNKFLIRFYAAAFVFFLVGAIVTLVYAKHVASQMGIGDSLKGLEGLKDLQKLIPQ